jgi:hypothetical protein
MDVNKAWETIRISKFLPKSLDYYELKQHKPWFKKGCLKLLDQKKQAWLQDSSKINGDNLNNITLEASRHFRNKRGNS